MTHKPSHEHHDEDQKAPAPDPSSQPDRLQNKAVPGSRPVAPRNLITRAAAGARTPDGGPQADADTCARAEALADRLQQLLERTPQCIESITQTLNGVDTLAASVMDTAEGSLRKVEATCIRAETLDGRLSQAADRLADEGEATQQRIELLLNGLDAGDLLQDHVQKCSEQLRTLVDEAQKASSRQAEKLGSLVATSHERLTALDQSANEVVKVTIETIKRQVEDMVAESGKRLNEQKDRAATASDELRVLQQTVERRLEALEESVCKKVGKSAGSQMREFEQEVRKTIATQLDQVTGVIDKCASSGQALARDAADAEHRLQQLEHTLTGISSVVGTAEEIAGSLKQQVADAAAAQEAMKNLNAETATTVQRGEEALTHRQHEVAALLDEAVTVADDLKKSENTARQRTDELSNRLQSAAELEETLSQVTAASGDALNAAVDQTTEMLTANSTAEALAAELQQYCTQATEAVAAAKTAGQTLRQDTDSIVRSTEDAVSRQREVMTDAIDEAKHRTECLEARIDDADRKAERLADAVMAAEPQCSKLEELSTTSGGLAARVEQRCADTRAAAEETFATLKHDLTALAQDTNGAVSRRQQALAQVVGEAETCLHTVEGVLEPAKQAAAQLSADVHTGTDLHDKLSLATNRASGLLDAARAHADTLSDINAEAERAAETAEAGINKLKQETGSLIKVGEEATAGQRSALETVAREAQSLADLLDSGIETAERNCERLSSRTHAAVEAESALCRITAVAHEIRDAIEHATKPLNEHIARSDALVGTLQEACSQADGTQQKVHDLNTDVAALISDGEESMARQHDVLFAAIAEAKERTDDLRASMAGAAQEREKIAEEYHRAVATATQAAERVDALIREVRSLTTGTEQRARELASEAHDARKLLEEMGPTRTEAEALRLGIAQQADSGRELVEKLKLQIDGGNETSGHLKAIQADSLRVVDRLASHCDNAESIAKRISQVAAELQSDHDAIVANRTTLNELSEQGRSLYDMVNRTQVATESVRVQVNSLLTEPQSVVCDAKQQALQLTNVCRAVKKVFAGLSKTSLGATEKIDQLAGLHADVTQATETLRQWVNEAAHVQQRLESTVRHAPAITQTHPPGRMYSLAEPPKRGGPAAMDKPQVAPAEATTDRSTATIKRSGSADSDRRISAGEVAELIADAKRRHEQENKPVPSL